MPCEICKKPIDILEGPGTYKWDYRNHTLSHVKCYVGLFDEKETKE